MLRSRALAVTAALGVLLAGGLAGAKALPATPEFFEENAAAPSFSVVVSPSESGIAATCERGCAWQTITARYPNYEYVISSAGVRPVMGQAAGSEEVAFSFRIAIAGADGGVRARCDHGCNWRSVTGGYPTSAYRIGSDGIEPARGPVQ